VYSDDYGTMFFNLKTMSTTFELRDAAIDRAKKRLEKYRRTAEKKEIDYDAYVDEKLRNDMRETNKYLGKGQRRKTSVMYSEIYFLFLTQNAASKKPISKAKVNESKMRKNKSKDGNKKDMPTGPGGLSQNQANEVQSKIREHIQSEIKKTPHGAGGVGGGVDKKRKKTQQEQWVVIRAFVEGPRSVSSTHRGTQHTHMPLHFLIIESKFLL